MAHIVQQIAEAMVAALDGATEAGSEVSHRRFWPAEKDKAAEVIVYSDIEDIASAGQGGLLSRAIAFKIAGRFSGDAATLEAKGYTFESAVEIALMTDSTLGGIATDIVPAMAQTVTDGSGNQPQLTRLLTYTVLAHTLAGFPETPH